MALGIRVTFRATSGAVHGERTIHQFPVRLGRNAINEVQVAHPVVSDFHCVIDVVSERVCLRDLNSKNGTLDRTGRRLEPGTPLLLESIGNPIFLGGAVEVTVEVLDEDVAFQPALLRASEVPSLPSLSFGERAEYAWPRPPEARYPAPKPMTSLPGGPTPLSMGASLPGLMPLAGVPMPSMEPGARGASPPEGPDGASRNTRHLSMPTETLALAGLRELASSLVPGVPLETTGDVARLLTKLHDLVEVVCRCFVVLRDSHSQWVSSVGLEASDSRRLGWSPSAARVELARDPSSLAAALLDWRNHDFDAPRAVERVMTDLIAHEAAMMEGVMRGVDALLLELSPATIEADARARGGVGVILGQHRVLWRTYEDRFEDVADEARRFKIVFGPEFAASYKEYRVRHSL